MKWDELPRLDDAERNKKIEQSKMTTGKWLWAVLALLAVAFMFDGAGKILAAVLIVGAILVNLAITRWAKPTEDA